MNFIAKLNLDSKRKDIICTYIGSNNPLCPLHVSADLTFTGLKNCDALVRKHIEHIPYAQSWKTRQENRKHGDKNAFKKAIKSTNPCCALVLSDTGDGHFNFPARWDTARLLLACYHVSGDGQCVAACHFDNATKGLVSNASTTYCSQRRQIKSAASLRRRFTGSSVNSCWWVSMDHSTKLLLLSGIQHVNRDNKHEHIYTLNHLQDACIDKNYDDNWFVRLLRHLFFAL